MKTISEVKISADALHYIIDNPDTNTFNQYDEIARESLVLWWLDLDAFEGDISDLPIGDEESIAFITGKNSAISKILQTS